MRVFEDENKKSSEEKNNILVLSQHEIKYKLETRLLTVKEFLKFKDKINAVDKQTGNFKNRWCLEDWGNFKEVKHAKGDYKTMPDNNFNKKQTNNEQNTDNEKNEDNEQTANNEQNANESFLRNTFELFGNKKNKNSEDNEMSVKQLKKTLWIYDVLNGQIEKPQGNETNWSRKFLVRPVIVFKDFSKDISLEGIEKFQVGKQKIMFTFLGKNDEGNLIAISDIPTGQYTYFHVNQSSYNKSDSDIYENIKAIDSIISDCDPEADQEKNNEGNNDGGEDSKSNGDSGDDEIKDLTNRLKKSKTLTECLALLRDGTFWKTKLGELNLTDADEMDEKEIFQIFEVLYKIKKEFREIGKIDFFDKPNEGFLALTANELEAVKDKKYYKQVKMLINWMEHNCPVDDIDEEKFKKVSGFSPKEILKMHRNQVPARVKVSPAQKKKKKESRLPGSRTTLFEDRSEKGFWEILSE